MRAIPALWFEALVAKDDAAPALEALAASGAFELETRGHPALTLIELSEPLRRYAELQRQYHAYWPLAQAQPTPQLRSPAAAVEQALAAVERWEIAARPLVLRWQAHERERSELRNWDEICAALANSRLDFSLLAQTGPLLAARVVLLPRGEKMPAVENLLLRRFELAAQPGWLLLGPAEALAQFCLQLAQSKARLLEIPPWARGNAAALRAAVADRLAVLANEIRQLQNQLAALQRAHDLQHALGDLLRFIWFSEQAGAYPESEVFVWITGWCSDRGRLGSALSASGARAAAHFPPAPDAGAAPLLLRNPRWAQPFELFGLALGMPGRNETDPSRLLAFIVPLLFGYMFGDVGQGMLLLVLGWVAQRRYAAARVLIPCGAASMLFGLLFGSWFSLHRVLPALWLYPLEQPLTVLGVPLAAGALLLTLGQLLQALQAFWQGRLRAWLAGDFGLLLLYLGALGAIWLPQTWPLAPFGILLYLYGQYRHSGRASALLAACVNLLENSLQLLANTLSFARVGAFALAHAGLSLAVASLAAAGGETAGAAVLLLGNLLIVVLEGLAVSIQTTRLMLFEFFLRFLRGEGRRFCPMPAPPYLLPGESHAC